MVILRLICLFLSGCLVSAIPVSADSLDSGFLFFQYLDMKKQKNGQVSQRFELVCTDNQVDTIEVFFRENQDPTVYQARVTDFCFSIFVDQPSRISLFAVAHTPGKILVAHTDIVLFGRSKIPSERQAADKAVKAFPAVNPYIELLSPEKYYWNQTGQTFRFHIKSPFDPGPLHLSVLENDRMHTLIPGRQSDFSYVPSHDLHLRKTGIQAARQDTLFTSITNGTTVFNLTYSLLLHRSRYAFNNPAAGAAVFGTSLLLFAGLIFKKRKTPWWKPQG